MQIVADRDGPPRSLCACLQFCSSVARRGPTDNECNRGFTSAIELAENSSVYEGHVARKRMLRIPSPTSVAASPAKNNWLLQNLSNFTPYKPSATLPTGNVNARLRCWL